MRKIILLLLIGIINKAQLVNNDTPTKQVVSFPTSAESYSLSKVEAIPMDYFRGKANLSIPIYTISIDGINIPISLSYNTGGIKLNEIPATVGLGWSLNIPGTISQNVMGSDDLQVSFFSKNIVDYGAYKGNFDINVNDEIRNNLESIYNNYYDTQKDIFDYNLPTASGAFILKDNNQAFLIPNDDLLITENDNKFYVKDTQGAEYWLASRNFVIPGSIGGPTVVHKTLYNLDEFKINNKSVLFYYEKSHSYDERNINEVASFKLPPKLTGSYEQLIPLPRYEKTETSTSFSESLISKISFDGGEVSFLYSNDNGTAFSDGSVYRKDLNGNGIALRRIKVTSKAGIVIKDISLNYSYFETDNTIKTYEDYRLKLTDIQDNLQNTSFSFDYNEQHKIPKRSSSNDDYWGYINNIYNGEITNIPDRVFDNNISSEEFGKVAKRNRESNEQYAILGSLKSIKYPTGAKKNFYYELPYNTVNEFTQYNSGLMPIGSLSLTATENEFSKSAIFMVSQAHFQQIQNLGIDAEPDKVVVSFGNTCKNAGNSGSGQTIEETQCTGFAKYGEKVFTHWQPKTVEWEPTVGRNLELDLYKIGSCKCSISSSIRYLYPSYTGKLRKYGSLRIRKIEDVDANNVSNVHEYAYGKYDNGIFTPDFKLNQRYNFSSIFKRQVREFSDSDISQHTQQGYSFERYYRVHNSSQSNTSYGSSDLINYPSVTEISGKGKIVREYETFSSSSYIYSKWKGGRLKREIYLNKSNDTLKVVKYAYKLNTSKNSLSGFNTNDPKNAAFSTDFTITKGVMSVLDMPVDVYNVQYLMYMIESAKIENDFTETIDYLNGKKVVSSIRYNYYNTDISKPINLQSIENTLPSGEKVKSTYSYAHEKGNQLMIDRNMVGIPLETTTTRTKEGVTKTLGKTETLYPASLPTPQAGNLVLPLSVKSVDQLTGVMATEVSYDKYDQKGNILQYTGKDGVPVTIVWGYNQTQPIAKVEGVTYDQLTSLASPIAIVTASDNDAADPSKEGLLLVALNTFRKNSQLADKKVTTYTYDPLIGVTSITPPSGIRQVFTYDTANRLKETGVRSKNSAGAYTDKKAAEYKYNYKP